MNNNNLLPFLVQTKSDTGNILVGGVQNTVLHYVQNTGLHYVQNSLTRCSEHNLTVCSEHSLTLCSEHNITRCSEHILTDIQNTILHDNCFSSGVCSTLSKQNFRKWTGQSGGRIPVGSRFSAPVQTGTGPQPVSKTMSNRLVAGVNLPGVALTIHPHLNPRLKKV
jgi:pyocin large subunit-like protein